MAEQIPLRTQLTLSLTEVPNSPAYSSTLIGYGRYGLQLTLPQLLTQSYSLPAQAKVLCSYLSPGGHDLLAFHSYVMGYEATTNPPLMVIAAPQSVESYNRRSARRFPVELSVGYMASVKGVFGEHTKTIDLSISGLRMQTSKPLPDGTALSLTLTLPDDVLLLGGSVAWSGFRGRTSMTGVRFTAMKSADAAALAKFLNQLEREQAGLPAKK
ncbi:MAG TPA: PilZ domain-containing protein [Symbiobacteriaceae bacterium]|nr:PilZ domain-containing protein [Symbiobacteriaceae bacterium]